MRRQPKRPRWKGEGSIPPEARTRLPSSAPLGSQCDGWSPGDPGSAPPRLRRRPPVSIGGRGSGSAPASPPPSCPPARRGKSARSSGWPAPGAGVPRPPARAPPAARRSSPARPLPRPEALAPGGSEDLRTRTWSGCGRRGPGLARYLRPARPRCGPAGACGRYVGGATPEPWAGGGANGKTGNPGTRRIP